MDDNFNKNLVVLEYFGMGNEKNYLKVNAPDGSSFKLNEVTCEFE